MSDVNGKGILADELEIVGFNGAPQVECGLSLPVVSRKSNRMHCVLNLAQRRFVAVLARRRRSCRICQARRWTRFTVPLFVPRSCISNPDGRLSRQPLVVFVAQSFLDAACVASWPGRFHDESFRWCHLEPHDDSIQAACGSAETVEALLDDWATELKKRFDMLHQRGEDPSSLKQIADFMLCAGKPVDSLASLFRYAMAQEPEKIRPTFDAFIRPEFPDVSWEAYLDEIKDLGEVLKSVPIAASPPVTARSRYAASRIVSQSMFASQGQRPHERIPSDLCVLQL